MSTTDNARSPIDEVIIGGRAVGSGRRVFVVAEAGVNHDGCVNTALRLVDVAVDAGATAVKFQVFRADDLVTKDGATAAYQRGSTGARSQRELLRGLELSGNAFQRVAAHCADRSILFMATPFSESAVAMIAEMGACAIKIASTDLVHAPLLMAAAVSGFPLILSTGASTHGEIQDAVHRLSASGCAKRLVLLHCVSSYPTPLEALNLRAISTLRRTFGLPCGLSDHTECVHVGGWAAAAGACVIEKHFTLDRSAPGPDHAMSLAPSELAAYIERVRGAERALGSGEIGMTKIEEDVRAVSRRSIVAACAVSAGSLLEPRMLTTKRPGSGIAPTEMDLVVGRRTLVDITPDEALTWEMLG